MAKKHVPNYGHTKPSYVHPSLQRSTPSSPSASASPRTVNERLSQLRREQAPRTTTQQRDELTERVTQRSIPLHLRQILCMSEIDSPPPKPGTRPGTVSAGPRPPPGPAAPRSWKQTEKFAVSKNTYSPWGSLSGLVERRDRLSALAQHHYSEFRPLPPAQSLVDNCLRTFAENWNTLVEWEQHNLAALPIQLKEMLFSYLTMYAKKGSLDLASLRILFACHHDTAGGLPEELQFLDLTGLLNRNYTIEDLGKSLGATPATPNSRLENSAQLKTNVPVAETWEDEADDTTAVLALPSELHLRVPIFSNLTRLSLERPGHSVSWKQLLTISKHLNRITHLSLAHWPSPSHYNDLEAADILGRFSFHTYSLKHLDLAGCIWFGALTCNSPYDRPAVAGSNNQITDYPWPSGPTSRGPDWNGHWRQIEYLNLYDQLMNKQMLRVLSEGFHTVGLTESETAEKEKAILKWTRIALASDMVIQVIKNLRSKAGGKWCTVVPFLGDTKERSRLLYSSSTES